jgi:hypothetical protein
MNYFGGYYEVGNQQFVNKFQAVLHSQRHNLPIQWNFFDQQFQQVQWEIEPSQSLDQLYQQRAHQIRDKYDYIILFCSGGADSTNMLHSFLDNGIRVDEIMSIAPISGLSQWNFNSTDISEENTISEIKYTMMPMLKEIANQWPQIKITVNDYFLDLVNSYRSDFSYDYCGNIVTILTNQFTDVLKFPHIANLIARGKKVGLIYGSDKPIIRIGQAGDLYFNFTDSAVNYLNFPQERQFNNLNPELFYWSIDLPELLIKQSHQIVKAICLPENRRFINLLSAGSSKIHSNESLWDINQNLISENQNPISCANILKDFYTDIHTKSFSSEVNNRTLYERLIVPFIYPSIQNKNLFQCQKIDSHRGFLAKDQIWLYRLHSDTPLSKVLLSDLNQLYNTVSSKFLNRQGTSFINFIKFYRFGNIKNFLYGTD